MSPSGPFQKEKDDLEAGKRVLLVEGQLGLRDETLWAVFAGHEHNAHMDSLFQVGGDRPRQESPGGVRWLNCEGLELG